MGEPDVRVNPDDLDEAGAELARVGTELADVARDPAAPRAQPAWSDGFASVGATARLDELWRRALDRRAGDVVAHGDAMRTAAQAWRSVDDDVAAALRAG